MSGEIREEVPQVSVTPGFRVVIWPAIFVLLGVLMGGAFTYYAWTELIQKRVRTNAFSGVTDDFHSFGAGLPHCSRLSGEQQRVCSDPAIYSDASVLQCLSLWGEDRRRCIVEHSKREDSLECRVYLVQRQEIDSCVASFARKLGAPEMCLDLSGKALVMCIEETAEASASLARCGTLGTRAERLDCTVSALHSIDENDAETLENMRNSALTRLLLNRSRDCLALESKNARRTCLRRLREKPVRLGQDKGEEAKQLSIGTVLGSYCTGFRSDRDRQRCVMALQEKDAGACLYAPAWGAKSCLEKASRYVDDQLCRRFEDNAPAFETCVTRLAAVLKQSFHCDRLSRYPRAICITGSADTADACQGLSSEHLPACVRAAEGRAK